MRCGRSDRIELDAFLLGAAGDEGAEEFREHYPHCAECAAAVADWMALDGALREVWAVEGDASSFHPEPEELVQYMDAPARLGARAGRVERHLAGCARCAGELRLIQGFDPAVFGPAAQAMPAVARDRVGAESGFFDSLREALVGFVEKLRGFDLLTPAPAFALAILVLAGLWLSGALGNFDGQRGESGEPQLVERRAPSSVPTTDPNAALPNGEPVLEGGAGEQALAVASESSATLPKPTSAGEGDTKPEALPSPAPEVMPAGESMKAAPVELAQAERSPSSSPMPPTPEKSVAPVEPESARASASGSSTRSDEVLLAALDGLPPPSYAAPEGADSLVWMRQFGAVRSAPTDAHVAARAPGEHAGLTLSSTPRLWWALDKATDLPIQITIVEGEAIDPVVRVELPGPHAAGLHAFDLAKYGAKLAPDVDYRWFVSILVDADRPSRNPVSAGALRVAGMADARRQAVSNVDASARGNKLAELGLWYDAFDFYASLAEAHPEVDRLAGYRDRLVEASKPIR